MSEKTKAAPNWRFERGKIACVGQTKIRVRVEFRDGAAECVCHRDSRCRVPHEFESDPDFLAFRENSNSNPNFLPLCRKTRLTHWPLRLLCLRPAGYAS